MQHQTIGRTIRALRHRRGLRQSDLARQASVARSVLSDLEAGRLDGHALGALGRVVGAAGGMLRIDVLVPGGDLSRLLDADHAAMQNAWKGALERFGWQVEAEVTFNHCGERGSIDLLAWHSARRVLLVGEVKSALVDLQALLASIDRKCRVARILAAERGWAPAMDPVPSLLVVEGTTARRRIAEHAALFARFSVRGPAARQWLREPATAVSGLLSFTQLPPARLGDRRRGGRRRIRVSAQQSADTVARKGG